MSGDHPDLVLHEAQEHSQACASFPPRNCCCRFFRSLSREAPKLPCFFVQLLTPGSGFPSPRNRFRTLGHVPEGMLRLVCAGVRTVVAQVAHGVSDLIAHHTFGSSAVERRGVLSDAQPLRLVRRRHSEGAHAAQSRWAVFQLSVCYFLEACSGPHRHDERRRCTSCF